MGPPGSPLSVLVVFSMFFVDFLMIFKVFGKKTKKFSSSFGFFTKSFGFFMFMVLAGRSESSESRAEKLPRVRKRFFFLPRPGSVLVTTFSYARATQSPTRHRAGWRAASAGLDSLALGRALKITGGLRQKKIAQRELAGELRCDSPRDSAKLAEACHNFQRHPGQVACSESAGASRSRRRRARSREDMLGSAARTAGTTSAHAVRLGATAASRATSPQTPSPRPTTSTVVHAFPSERTTHRTN